MPLSNELYLTVLPLVYVNKVPSNPFAKLGRPGGYGQGAYGQGTYGTEPQVEQVLTLFPDKDFATAFFPDEVDRYIQEFDRVAKDSLVGGHVIGYNYSKETTDDGRIIVKVVQRVE